MRDMTLKTHNDFSFEGAAVVEDVDVVLTPAFEYSDTRFSKKFVFPWSEIMSMKSKGFDEL
jgi:hypothetical protein